VDNYQPAKVPLVVEVVVVSGLYRIPVFVTSSTTAPQEHIGIGSQCLKDIGGNMPDESGGAVPVLEMPTCLAELAGVVKACRRASGMVTDFFIRNLDSQYPELYKDIVWLAVQYVEVTSMVARDTSIKMSSTERAQVIKWSRQLEWPDDPGERMSDDMVTSRYILSVIYPGIDPPTKVVLA
jgi:hypothetical protein